MQINGRITMQRVSQIDLGWLEAVSVKQVATRTWFNTHKLGGYSLLLPSKKLCFNMLLWVKDIKHCSMTGPYHAVVLSKVH